MNLKELTIIIPTYNNRHKYLNRVLDYLGNFNGTVIIADSSEFRYSNENIENVEYLHLPELNLGQKIYYAAQRVKTKYCMLLPDDDFVTFSGIHKCIIFLNKNSEYSSAQGNWLGFENKGKISTFIPSVFRGYNLDVGENFPTERIKRFYFQYAAVHYAIHRTQNLIDTYEVCKNLSPEFIPYAGEDLFNMISLINGKHRILPVLFRVLEYNPASSAYRYCTVGQLIKENRCIDDYQFFRISVSKALAKKESIEFDDAEKYTKSLFSKLYETHNLPHYSPLKKTPLVRKVINKIPFIKYVKRTYTFFYDSSLKIKLRISNLFLQREMNYIKSIIKKHGII